MKRIVKLALALAFTVGLVAMAASPAGANTGVGVFTGEATVTPGLNFPDPIPGADPASASWSISANSGCIVTAGDNAPNVRTGPTDCGFSGSGTVGPVAGLVGPACGASSGTGSGTLRINGENHGPAPVSWASSIGSVFPVVSNSSAGTAVALVQVRPSTPQDCLGAAGKFTVIVVAAVTH
jgi:hypothetical protein